MANTPIADTLKGYVYVDSHQNGVMDKSDWAIGGATVTLTQLTTISSIANGITSSSTASSVIATATTAADGSYSISTATLPISATTGTSYLYQLAMTTPINYAGLDNGHSAQLFDSTGKLLSSAGTIFSNTYTIPNLFAHYMGTNYNFGEKVYPLALFSKQLLMGGDISLSNTFNVVTTGITPTPEPGSLVLLGIAAAAFGMTARRRWLRRSRLN